MANFENMTMPASEQRPEGSSPEKKDGEDNNLEELTAEMELRRELDNNTEVVLEQSVDELLEVNKESVSEGEAPDLEAQKKLQAIDEKESRKLNQWRSENKFLDIAPSDYKRLLDEGVINQKLYNNLVDLENSIINASEFSPEEINNKEIKGGRAFNEDVIKLQNKQAEAHEIIGRMLDSEAMELELRRRQAERAIIRAYSEKKQELAEESGAKLVDKGDFKSELYTDKHLDKGDDIKINKEWDKMSKEVEITCNDIKNITEKDTQSLLDEQNKAITLLSELMADEDMETKLFEANEISIKKGQKSVFKAYRDIAAQKISEQEDKDRFMAIAPWLNKKARINYNDALGRLDNKGTKLMLDYFNDKQDEFIEDLSYNIADAQKKDEVLKKLVGEHRVEIDFRSGTASANKLLQKLGVLISENEVKRVQEGLDKKRANYKKKK